MAREDAGPDHRPDPEHHEVEGAERALEAASRSPRRARPRCRTRSWSGTARSLRAPRAAAAAHAVLRKAGMIACGVFAGRREARPRRSVLVVMRQGADAGGDRGRRGGDRGARLQGPPDPGRAAHRDRHHRQPGAVDRPVFESLPGVLEVIPVTHAYKLVSREVKPEDSVVSIGGVPVGGGSLVIVAGPCAVESRGADADGRARGEGQRARTCCAAAPSSRAPARTRSRASARRGCRSWPRPARRRGCPSSPRRSTPTASTSSSATPTRSRSAPATCRTSRCSSARAGRRSRCC